MQKTLFLVAVMSAQLVCGGFLDQLNMKLAENIATCASSNGINPFQMAALSTLQSPSDTATQCFLACVAKAAGIMKPDNTFDKANTVTAMKPLIDIINIGKNVDTTSVMNSIADTCTAQPAIADECVAAKKAFDCLIQNAKTSGL